MITIRTVSDERDRRRLTQRQYVARMVEVQSEAVRSRDMGSKTAAFWKMENLSANFLKHAEPGESLRDPRLPLEIRPIAHCGMGIAAVEVADFAPEGIEQVIESFSDPDYTLFAYEGSGAMLSLYEPDMFGLAARGFGTLGIIPMARLRRPDQGRFIEYFRPEIRWLIAHGFGRMLYFKSHSIVGAIESARCAAFMDFPASVQGIAFAYSMVNNSDLDRVFMAGEHLDGTSAGAAFRNGLIYALEFWEWMAPGFLERLETRTRYGTALVAAAFKHLADNRKDGVLAAFNWDRAP